VDFTINGLTNGQQVDLVSGRTDNGTNLECVCWDTCGSTRGYSFRVIPLHAKTADFTMAVQQSRWVEFTVKPEVGGARLVNK
jgi:hypothetical protein